MGDKQSLGGTEAIKKIKDIATDKICLLCTYADGQIVSRPMATQAVEEDGTVWFFSGRSSEKNQQINDDDTVHLMYMDQGKQQYLSITGTARILKDRTKTEELWTPTAKAWFEEGKEDPDLTLIRVTPQEGHYWDTKNGKLVSMLKIAAAVLSGGEKDDGGVDGDLRL